MRSALTIIAPAVDVALLTVEELRAVAGVTGPSQDEQLQALERRVAAAITSECRVAVGRTAAPTLRRERCEERLFRLRDDVVFLSRRHEVELVSVFLDGLIFPLDECDVDPENGEFLRLAGGQPVSWSGGTITIVYDAGFEEVPADLKMAAMDFFRLAWLERERDPSLKVFEEDVEGVLRTRKEFWVGAVPGQSGEGAVPGVVSGQLLRFMNTVVA